MATRDLVTSLASIEGRIHSVRGHRVMLDADLARLYRVTTSDLNKSVHRNIARFPSDFSFMVPWKEMRSLMFQIGISNSRGGRRKPVRVFTEHGVAMLSSVLRSPRAIHVNIAIMRAFSHYRKLLAGHEALALRLKEMEGACDARFKRVLETLRHLMVSADEPSKERIGFHPTRSMLRSRVGRARMSAPSTS